MVEANGRLQQEYLSTQITHSCRVCDRLWFDTNLSSLSTVSDYEIGKIAMKVVCKA